MSEPAPDAPAPSPQEYFREQVPAQFNRLLGEQERAVEEAQRVLDSMRAVTATLCVVVEGEGGGTFYLNVADGVMSAADEPAQEPFLTVLQDRAGFERVVREAGDSALGMLGGLSGLAGEMRLTRSRIDNLAGVSGCLEFCVSGDDGFRLRTHFGPGPVPDAPDTTIRVDADGYRKLRAGELAPHDAFLQGAIAVEGDMNLAMQLALAALSPD